MPCSTASATGSTTSATSSFISAGSTLTASSSPLTSPSPSLSPSPPRSRSPAPRCRSTTASTLTAASIARPIPRIPSLSNLHLFPPVPSIAISRTEPDFSFKTQPSALTRRQTSHSAPRGKLLVKLISARHLSPPSAASRPYVVVTFDQNEFVSREPIHEEGEEATGVAKPRPLPQAQAQTIQALKEAEGDVKELAAGGKLPRMPDEPPADTSKEKDLLKAVGSSPLSKSPSALGRSLEEYQNAEKAPRPTLGPVIVDVPRVSDEAKTPTGTADEPQNELLGTDASMAYNPTWKHEVFFDVMNEKSVLQVQIYDRSIEEEMFLGVVEIRPKLVNNHTVDQWFPLQARPGEDHEVTGEIRIQIRYEKFDGSRAARPPVQPLTNSVQENFRGFTFSGEGESMIHQAAGQLSRLSTDDHDVAAPGGAATATSRRSASSGSGSGSNGRAGSSSGSGHGHHDPDDEWVDER
ncbi:SPOSA6832_01008 [Sporobolomyces salmonicolor]|uniref:SPOSA6832_01008-mRNA-1:cds n=1 Tax=Sporidiobolus salmonicolor TaxID=5005 RepID=A0A0D6EHT0_SPOSA|nr:SPOSA6832_01008 [Sporobolomyces salmonicolor]